MANIAHTLRAEETHPDFVCLRYPASAKFDCVKPKDIVGDPVSLGDTVYLYDDGTYHKDPPKDV